MRSVAFIFVLIISSFSQTIENEECFKVYLATANFSESCKEFFDDQLEKYHLVVESLIGDNKNQTCMMEVMETNDYDSIFLHGLSKNRADGGDEKVFLENLESSIKSLMFAPELICDMNETYVTILNYTKTDEKLEHDDECILKHLDEINFYNSTIFDFGVDFENIEECDKNVNDKLQEIYPPFSGNSQPIFGLSRDSVLKCIDATMRIDNWAAHFYMIEKIHTRFELNEQQNDESWKMFKNFTDISVHEMTKCFRELQ